MVNDNLEIDLVSEDALHTITRLAEGLPGGFFIYRADEGKELLFFNSFMVSLYGCTDTEDFISFTGNSFKGLVHPDDYANIENEIAEQIKNNNNLDYATYRIIRKDGSIGYVDDYGRFLNTEAFGDVFYVFVQDSTKRFEKRQREEEYKQELISQMMGGESLYSVNIKNDTFTVLYRSQYLEENYKTNVAYSKEIKEYIERDVYEADRKKFTLVTSLSSIRERVNKELDYSEEYRDTSTGVPRWYQIRFVRTSSSEILLGFKNIDNEHTSNEIQRRMNDDFFAMLDIDLDSNFAKITKNSPFFNMGEVGVALPYDVGMIKFAAELSGEDRHFFESLADPENVRHRLSEKNRFGYIYKSPLAEQWVRVLGIAITRDENGKLLEYALNFSFLDDESGNEEELQQVLKEVETSHKFIESVSSEYDNVYKINKETGELTELWAGDKGFVPEKNDADVNSLIEEYISKYVFEPDREMLRREFDIKYVSSKLATQDRYTVLYREYKKDHVVWQEAEVIAIDENNLVIGFKEKNDEIILRDIERATFEDRFALFYVDLDSGELQVIKGSPWDENLNDGDCLPYKDAIKSIGAEYYSEVGDFYDKLSDIEYAKELLGKDEKFTYSYTSNYVAGKKWITITGRVIMWHEDGSPMAFSLDFALMDSLGIESEEIKERMNEDNEIIGSIANDYLALYYANIDENIFKAYNIDTKRLVDTRDFIAGQTDALELLNKFIQSNAVHPEDKVLFDITSKEAIREKLRGRKKYSIRFRRDYGQGYQWSVMDIIKYEAVDEEANSIIVGFAERDSEIVREINQRKQLEVALASADLANKSKSDFLFSMSHDIRTPMNAIKGFTAMAKKYIDDKPRLIDYLNKIDISGEQLTSLINQVLEMSRIESGKVEISTELVNVKKRFTSSFTVLSSQAQDKGLEFNASLNNIKHENVFADDAKMGQITLNLVGNAIKYTPSG